MKIAVALFAYFPQGGMQRDCLAVAQGLAARGNALTIYTRSWRGSRPDGIDVELLPARGLTNHARNAAFARGFAKAITRDRADFVLGFDRMPGLDAYFMADRCYAGRIASRPALHRLTPRARAMLAMEEAVFGTGSRAEILLLVEAEEATIHRHYATPPERFHRIPPIVDAAFHRPPDAVKRRATTRGSLGLAPDDLALLFVAARFHTKGLDRALHAVATLPEGLRLRTRLLVVGGDDPQRYRRHAGARQARFLGVRDDLPDLMWAADLLLHPAREELAGKVLVEALAADLPVLCSGIAGYAAHVARADAGCVLAEPFVQADLDRALAAMLPRLPTAPWSANGAAYAARTPGFGQGIAVAVDTIDRLARERGRR
ncbi:MAG: glycosyltransferase family 4 protein [Alphaproteobacteria bacterium]|nr:glycosyltransferase family 4 protein [Alphaproteobacteria bacterium]